MSEPQPGRVDLKGEQSLPPSCLRSTSSRKDEHPLEVVSSGEPLGFTNKPNSVSSLHLFDGVSKLVDHGSSVHGRILTL